MNRENFYEEASKLGIDLDKTQKEKMEIFLSFLKEENKKYNLTSIKEDNEIYLKHFYDSMTLVKAKIDFRNKSVLDIGTGAGFPGIIIKLLFSDINLYLVESSEKKCNFLKMLCEKLELTSVHIINKRMEEIKEIKEIDIVLSRAVAKTSILLEYGMPVLKLEGVLLAMKTEREEPSFKNACKNLKCELKEEIVFNLPYEESSRKLLVFQKKEATPVLFPRSYSRIKNKPL
jgi:16S rRNA (guanine527-N7)-methyltransferase